MNFPIGGALELRLRLTMQFVLAACAQVKSPKQVHGGFAMKRTTMKATGAALVLATICGLAMMVMSTSASYAQSRDAYCRAYARDVSMRYSRGGAVGGAVRGGTGGAIIGGIVGGRKGARRGAAIGATTGAVSRGVQRGVSYDALYRDCMRGIIRY